MLTPTEPLAPLSEGMPIQQAIQEAVEAAVQKERERCAEFCRAEIGRHMPIMGLKDHGAVRSAQFILARILKHCCLCDQPVKPEEDSGGCDPCHVRCANEASRG